MKRILFIFLFLVLINGIVFAEFQFDFAFGYFFQNESQDSQKRSFNGLNLFYTARYLFTERVGLFLGLDVRRISNANNYDYFNNFGISGLDFIINSSNGAVMNINTGLALALPINQKFRLQSDLGIKFNINYWEVISGEITINPYRMHYGIYPDKLSSTGIYWNVFMRYFNIFIFGIQMDYIFVREESGEFIIGGTSQRYTIKANNFNGFSIAPFLGVSISSLLFKN